MSEFQKGDVVELKSGGPAMTVSDVGNYSGMSLGPEDGVKCVWFESVKGVRTAFEKVFDAAVLTKKAASPVGPLRVTRG